jgi:hypothetical protein
MIFDSTTQREADKLLFDAAQKGKWRKQYLKIRELIVKDTGPYG